MEILDLSEKKENHKDRRESAKNSKKFLVNFVPALCSLW